MKAVVLARGRGTRMQAGDADAPLSDEQRRAADAGQKAMMPLAWGRPFLDWVVSALADAGVREICLVTAPGNDLLQRYYGRLTLTRVRIATAVQTEPRGTADAVLSAESFVNSEPFLVLNGDNYYPAAAVRAVMAAGGAAVAAFQRDALLQHGNIGPERIARYALLAVDGEGMLRGLVEKPDAATLAARARDAVGMNLWLLTPSIFAACRAIAPSARGELELPHAVQHCIDAGEPFRAVPVEGEAAAVLDLTSRADVPAVSARLGRRRPVL